MKITKTADWANLDPLNWERQLRKFKRFQFLNLIFALVFGALGWWAYTSEIADLPRVLLSGVMAIYCVRYLYRSVSSFLTVRFMNRMIIKAQSN